MNYSTVHDLTCIACCICTRWLFLPIVCQLHETLHPHPESETALRLGLFTVHPQLCCNFYTFPPILGRRPIQRSCFHPRPSSAVKKPGNQTYLKLGLVQQSALRILAGEKTISSSRIRSGKQRHIHNFFLPVQTTEEDPLLFRLVLEAKAG